MPSGDTWTSNIMVLQFATIHRNIITGYGCFINFKEHIEVDSPYSFSGGRGSIRVWTLLTIIDVIYKYCFKPWPTEKLCYSPNICSSNRSPFFSGFIIQNGYSFMLLLHVWILIWQIEPSFRLPERLMVFWLSPFFGYLRCSPWRSPLYFRCLYSHCLGSQRSAQYVPVTSRWVELKKLCFSTIVHHSFIKETKTIWLMF